MEMIFFTHFLQKTGIYVFVCLFISGEYLLCFNIWESSVQFQKLPKHRCNYKQSHKIETYVQHIALP